MLNWLVPVVMDVWSYAHQVCRPGVWKWSFEGVAQHRFSAFWLRSKCSICSYQLNIWYVVHWTTTILNWFLRLDDVNGIYSAFVTGWPGIAVPPGSAHSPQGEKQNKKIRTLPLIFPPLKGDTSQQGLISQFFFLVRLLELIWTRYTSSSLQILHFDNCVCMLTSIQVKGA